MQTTVPTFEKLCRFRFLSEAFGGSPGGHWVATPNDPLRQIWLGWSWTPIALLPGCFKLAQLEILRKIAIEQNEPAALITQIETLLEPTQMTSNKAPLYKDLLKCTSPIHLPGVTLVQFSSDTEWCLDEGNNHYRPIRQSSMPAPIVEALKFAFSAPDYPLDLRRALGHLV